MVFGLVGYALDTVTRPFRNFVRRHKRGLIITAIGGVGAYYAYIRVRDNLTEAFERLERRKIVAARNQHRFASIQQARDFMLRSALAPLQRRLLRLINSEALYHQLLESRRTGVALQDKYEIWDQLKVQSFTRTLTAIYTLCLMDALLRVQLNIVGHHVFFASSSPNPAPNTEWARAASAASTEDSPTPHTPGRQSAAEFSQILKGETPRKFLSYAEFIYDSGLDALAERVREAVTLVVSECSLKSALSVSDLNDILGRIRAKIEHPRDLSNVNTSIQSLSPHPLSEFVLPRDGDARVNGGSTESDTEVTALLDETRDLLESPEFNTLLTSSVDTAFDAMMFKLTKLCFTPTTTQSRTPVTPHTAQSPAGVGLDENHPRTPSTLTPRKEPTLPLGKIIRPVNGLIHSVLTSEGNEFIQAIDSVPEMDRFCEMVCLAEAGGQHG